VKYPCNTNVNQLPQNTKSLHNNFPFRLLEASNYLLQTINKIYNAKFEYVPIVVRNTGTSCTYIRVLLSTFPFLFTNNADVTYTIQYK